jgi:alkylation response protein AidB-like acyl-CoA dehydrogenase
LETGGHDEEEQVPIAISPEQRALQASIREWANQAGTIALVRRLEPGQAPRVGAGEAAARAGEAAARAGEAGEAADWAEHWEALATLGIFSIALPAAVGGADGTVADLAAALEELTHALAPGPVLPTLLAGLLLRGQADHPAAKELLPALASGQASAAVGLATGPLTNPLTGTWLADGTLRVSGETGPVLGAGATSHLLLGACIEDGGSVSAGEVWFLIPAGHEGIEVAPCRPVDFSRSLARIRLTSAVVTPDDILTGLTTAAVRDFAATLFCAEAAAVAGFCSGKAAAYARTRYQFGRPIGSFQAVKHLCAGMLCRAESASAAAWDAARAADEAPDEHPLAAAAAAALALDAAVDNAKDCIQVLGGIGFTWEHDAHLYLRRALALRQLLGGSAVWRARAGELALAGGRRQLRLSVGGPDTEAIAGAAQSVAATIAALPPQRQRVALADAGYVAPQWPAPYGLSASPAEQLVIDQELNRAGVSRPDLVIGGWAGPAIIKYGTPAQRERFVRPTLRGEITWCQLFSEPDAGSDLAAVRTRAVRAEGEEAARAAGEGEERSGWRLTGQKVWTSLAHEADWAICLARTDPDAPKHRGLTYFLVDMHSGGIEIRPLREITGRAAFNEVFLDGVFVPDDCVVGECGDGWRIARSTLATERVAMGRGSALGDEVERLIGAVTAAGLAGEPSVQEQVGALVASGLAGSLMDLRSAMAQLAGADDGHQAAVRKLVGVAHRQAVAETALTLCGPDGAASDGPAADAVHGFLLSRCLSIAGGTSQILLNVVAERALGLPREETR